MRMVIINSENKNAADDKTYDRPEGGRPPFPQNDLRHGNNKQKHNKINQT